MAVFLSRTSYTYVGAAPAHILVRYTCKERLKPIFIHIFDSFTAAQPNLRIIYCQLLLLIS
jgi:hypothetical protein